jgi:O-glycosyl hydrolase
MKISRRDFHATLLSASAVAQAANQDSPAPPPKLALPASPAVAAGGEPFDFPLPPSQRLRWKVNGLRRQYFMEWLPALFERTLVIEEWKTAQSQLQWIFTGPMGGFTVEAGAGKVRLFQRYDDSPALAKFSSVKNVRHPEAVVEESSVEYTGELQSIAVTLDYRLTLRVALNGQESLVQHCLLDVNRHQLAMATEEGGFRGRLLPAVVGTATVEVDPATRHQQMIGWGGTTTPPAFAELSPEGQRAWWRKLVEYNLLLHREYPIGAQLNPKMTNWDRPQDASPHYYGDNFPNCETSDFAYNRRVRQLGGKVIFEFWELPVWARQRDSQGQITDLPKLPEYAKAMVRYCQVSKEKSGAPPEIVGVQNEVKQPPEIWQQMAVTLREALDDAGFRDVKIHMHNPPTLAEGVAAARAFHATDAAWKAIDYATSNVYDYQNFFYDPDGFDERVREMKEAISSKPFLASELCVNNTAFQTRTYRTALAMGQLYHKLLTSLDACGAMYCWTLLNVTQPSYGWTRTLMVPDPEHGFAPVASSHQLRVFGAYSRRVHEGMIRLRSASSNPNLLVTAFTGDGGRQTLIVLNRSTARQKISVRWPGATFRYQETASPQSENAVETAPTAKGDFWEVTVDPGAIVTLTGVELGRVADDFFKA